MLQTIFFILEQIIHKHDARYESFLSKVAPRDVAIDMMRLRQEVGILSWNYDSQIELAYRSFFNDGYSTIRETLGFYDVKDYEQKQTLQKYCKIIKLNGTANFTREKDWMMYSDNNMIDETILKKILKGYDTCSQLGRPCDGLVRLNFAWERLWSDDMLTNKIPKLVHDAQTLVVIGYTFPDYNRDIDRFIFENMSNLKDIYIQDKSPDRIQQRITLVIPENKLIEVKIHPHDDVDQFLIPPQL